MSISVQCLPQKISAHFQFQSEHLGQLFVTLEMITQKIKKMKGNKS